LRKLFLLVAQNLLPKESIIAVNRISVDSKKFGCLRGGKLQREGFQNFFCL
jgi:hypothetical protein